MNIGKSEESSESRLFSHGMNAPARLFLTLVIRKGVIAAEGREYQTA